MRYRPMTKKPKNSHPDLFPLSPTTTPSPLACARAISGEHATCGVYQKTPPPAGDLDHRAGDLLRILELKPHYLQQYRFYLDAGCEPQELLDELLEEQAREEAGAIRKAEAARLIAEAETRAEVDRRQLAEARAEWAAWQAEAIAEENASLFADA